MIGFSQKENDTIKIKKILNEVNINAIRAKKQTPIAFTNISKQNILGNVNATILVYWACRAQTVIGKINLLVSFKVNTSPNGHNW